MAGLIGLAVVSIFTLIGILPTCSGMHSGDRARSSRSSVSCFQDSLPNPPVWKPITDFTVTVNGAPISVFSESSMIVVDYLTPLLFDVFPKSTFDGTIQVTVGLGGYGSTFDATNADLPISVTPNQTGVGTSSIILAKSLTAGTAEGDECQYSIQSFEVVPLPLPGPNAFETCQLCGNFTEGEFAISSGKNVTLQEFGVAKICSEWLQDGLDGRLSQSNCQFLRPRSACHCRILLPVDENTDAADGPSAATRSDSSMLLSWTVLMAVIVFFVLGLI
jgi:hypothetical protein